MPAGSSPLAGSSRSSSFGSLSRARGDAQPLLHARASSVETLSRARSRRPTSSSTSSTRPAGSLARRSRQARAGSRGRQVRVERRRSRSGADLEQEPPVAPRRRLAEQLDRAAVGVDQPRQEAHRRGLAGAVRPEEAVDDARGTDRSSPASAARVPKASRARASPGEAAWCRATVIRQDRRPRSHRIVPGRGRGRAAPASVRSMPTCRSPV